MKNSKGLVFLLLILFVFYQPAVSQNKYTYTLGANVLKGFVVKHDKFMGHLSQGPTHGFEVSLNKNTYGYQPWEQVFNYPDVGFSLSYFDYAAEELGQSVTGVSYADFTLNKNRWSDLIFKIGTGIGYHTKPYNREHNNKNVAVASRFSFTLQGRLGFNVKLYDRLKMANSITFSHFSMAAYKQPNKGLNIVSVNTGLAYRLEEEKVTYQFDKASFQYDPSLKYNLSFSYTLKEINPLGSRKHPVYVASFYVNKQVSHTNIVNAGIDAFSNTSLKAEMIKNQDVDLQDPPDHRRIGVTVGHELALNRVALLTQLGVYIYRKYKTDRPLYQRYALKYYFDDLFFASIGFKTHLAKADHAECSLGIRL